MIIIYAGNIGSGKTLNAVREMKNTPFITYYTNIKTKSLPNVKRLNESMIIKRTDTGKVSKGKIVYEYSLNKEFWEKVNKPVSIVLDEIHSIFDARSSTSTKNKIVSQWIALLRKMIGESQSGYGSLILITQLSRRVDIIAREMAHQVAYFRCYYLKKCLDCGKVWHENSDMPEQRVTCKRCGSYKLVQFDHKTLKYKFSSVANFDNWRATQFNEYAYDVRLIKNIEKYFKYYDTLQMDDLFSEY